MSAGLRQLPAAQGIYVAVIGNGQGPAQFIEAYTGKPMKNKVLPYFRACRFFLDRVHRKFGASAIMQYEHGQTFKSHIKRDNTRTDVR